MRSAAASVRPVVLGRRGVVRELGMPLDEGESGQLHDSAAQLREVIRTCETEMEAEAEAEAEAEHKKSTAEQGEDGKGAVQ